MVKGKRQAIAPQLGKAAIKKKIILFTCGLVGLLASLALVANAKLTENYIGAGLLAILSLSCLIASEGVEIK